MKIYQKAKQNKSKNKTKQTIYAIGAMEQRK